MIIANPIYDVVFKRLMENEKVVKFFIGTLINQNIEAVEIKPQEFTYIKNLDLDDPEVQKYIKERVQERLSINILRLDFVATIKTESGEYTKVLIEIQKARNPIDLIRFRSYLAEQYKKEDKVNGEDVVLPMTTIYILGFNLPEITTPCIKVERNYKDLINGITIPTKSDFVERLTHDSFVVQVERITNRYQTRLDKLLSIFEQNNFVDDREIIKDFTHNPDIEELKIMTDILQYAGANAEERKKMETEKEGERILEVLTGGFRQKAERLLKEVAKQEQILSEQKEILDTQKQVLSEQEKALSEQGKVLSEKDQALNEKDQALIELQRQMEELKKQISDNQQRSI
jgi:hypothetical protein